MGEGGEEKGEVDARNDAQWEGKGETSQSSPSEDGTDRGREQVQAHHGRYPIHRSKVHPNAGYTAKKDRTPYVHRNRLRPEVGFQAFLTAHH
jgi:hypothetical protein